MTERINTVVFCGKYKETLKTHLKTIDCINLLLIFVCILLLVIRKMFSDIYMFYLDIILALCFTASFLLCNVLHKLKAAVYIDIVVTIAVCFIFAMMGGAGGFGVLWLILLPPIYIYALPFISGLLSCSVMTVGIMIIFWSPLNTFCYSYGKTFFMDFPLLIFISASIAVITKYVITDEEDKQIKSLSENIKIRRRLQKKVDEQAMEISERIDESSMMQHSMVLAAANVIEVRDKITGRHIRHSSEYAYMLANELYKKHMNMDIIDEEFLRNFREAALLHDIGKMQVPDAILKKEGKLTEKEFEIMKTHAQAGGDLIKKCIRNPSFTKLAGIGYEVASYHHERWDGYGYPEGRKGEDIPLSARIMSVADVFEAITAKRTYKPAYPVATAFNIIERESGKQFDPKLVDVFIGMSDKICRRYEELGKAENHKILRKLELNKNCKC